MKAFVSVRDEACLSCHQASRNPQTARQVAANEAAWGGPTMVSLVHDHAAHDLLRDAAPPPRDVNGKVQAAFRMGFNHPNDRCASCHLEHLADAPLKTAAPGGPAAPPKPHPTPVLRMTNEAARDCHDKLRERLGTTTLRDVPRLDPPPGIPAYSSDRALADWRYDAGPRPDLPAGEARPTTRG